MRVRIQPYRAGSRSARALSEATGIRRVRLVRTRFRPRPGDRILNWGSNNVMFNCDYINHPYRVADATDKVVAYSIMEAAGVCVPPHTTSREQAEEWAEEGAVVLARTLTRANGGRGIVQCEDPDDVPNAPLYTKYIPKYDEYRVHVFGGEVIDIQQKRRRHDYDQPIDSRVRNATGGWVFCRGDVEAPDNVMEEAQRAVRALRLDFGAVDIGFTRRSGRATVYEVNCAPGLEGTTVSRYAAAARRILY